MKILLYALLLVMSNANAKDDFFQNHAEGWFWYKDPRVAKQIIEQNSKSSIRPEKVDEDREKMEQALKIAYQHPTEDNIVKFIRLRNKILDQSYKFALRLKQMSLFHPELDSLDTYPTNAIAKDLYIAEKKKQVESKIKALSNKYGLFYIFSNTCPYCHTFAHTVKSFAQKFGWQILPITVNGPIAEFPNARLDNGIVRRLNIVKFPTLIAVEPKLGKAIPIAVGITSEEQIIEQIDLLTRDITP